MGYELDRLVTLVKLRPHALLSAEAYNAHGISLERASAESIDPGEIFDWFTAIANGAGRRIGQKSPIRYSDHDDTRSPPIGPWDTKLPTVFAIGTDDFVYYRLAPGLPEEVRTKNPVAETGHRSHRASPVVQH